MTSLPVIPRSLKSHDNTMMEAFNRCPRLYQLKHIGGWRSPGKSAALTFGELMHIGLSVWYDTKDRDATAQAMFDQDYPDFEGDYRTKERAILTMVEYIDYYGEDENWKILMTETPFEVEDENGFRWSGKMDLLVEWNSRLWVVDHKTTSRGGPSYWDQFGPDTQTAGYVYAASLLAGREVSGAIINQLLVHKVKKSPEQQFNRRPFMYQPWQLEEWYDQQVRTYGEIAAAHENGFRPRWGQCANKYGRCEMFDVCRTSPVNRDRFLEQNYIVDHWDPTDVTHDLTGE